MNQIDMISQNIDEFFLMGRQIEELLIHQHTYLDIFSDNNSYRQNDDKMAADMLAEGTTNSIRIEIAKDILQMNDKYKQRVLQPLLDSQEKIFVLLLKFNDVYNQTDFTVANYDESIIKFETRYKRWLSLTEELHQERLKAVTSVRNLMDFDVFIPNHIINNNGDSKVMISKEEFMQKGAAAELLIQARTNETDIAKRRTPLSIELFGELASNIKVKQDEVMRKESGKMPAQAESSAKNRLLLQLDSMAKSKTGITIELIMPMLNNSSENLSVIEVKKLVMLASQQVGIWSAEWMYSPFNSPNTTAKQESEKWDSVRKTWLNLIEEQVHGVKEEFDKMHDLRIAECYSAKCVNYYSNKPLKRFIASSLHKLSTGLYKVGLEGFAIHIGTFAMYPKGTVGRVL